LRPQAAEFGFARLRKAGAGGKIGAGVQGSPSRRLGWLSSERRKARGLCKRPYKKGEGKGLKKRRKHRPKNHISSATELQKSRQGESKTIGEKSGANAKIKILVLKKKTKRRMGRLKTLHNKGLPKRKGGGPVQRKKKTRQKGNGTQKRESGPAKGK